MTTGRTPVACLVFGHRLRFSAHGRDMTWECARGCGEIGIKQYATCHEAEMFAAAFDREDSQDLGRRAPFLGLFPLRLWRKLRQHND